jgi:hypothetical protein
MAYQVYLGGSECAARLPELLPTGPAQAVYIDTLLDLLTRTAGPGDPGR